MKANPIALPSGLPANWLTTGLAAAIGGVGVMAALYMGLLGKGKKMTKLEKACVAVLVALGEKVEELEKEKSRLSKEVAETDRKRFAEAERASRAEAKAEQAENRVTETIQRVDAAEVRLREVEAAADARIRELEAELRAMREARPSRKSHRR